MESAQASDTGGIAALRGVGVLRCETRNISFEGVCIDTGLFALSPSAEIELIFTWQDDATAAVIRSGAYVVRSDDSGIGISSTITTTARANIFMKLLD